MKKKKTVGLVENIKIPLYRITINVLIAEDCDKAVNMSKIITKDYIRKYDWKSMNGAFIGLEDENIYAIVLSKNCGIETISHECFHATMCVLGVTGIKFCDKSEECFAYVIGYLTNEVYKLKKEFDELYLK